MRWNESEMNNEEIIYFRQQDTTNKQDTYLKINWTLVPVYSKRQKNISFSLAHTELTKNPSAVFVFIKNFN